MENFSEQINKGERFEFGKNWKDFLQSLDNDRIQIAEDSLKLFLKVDSLKGMKFLDIGCGSGLFSLAASKMGAEVTSLDFDPNSVWCTKSLKSKYASDSNWKIMEGSALDEEFLKSLGKFDVVYSWGVLHHTGNMNLALQNALIPVKDKGKLFIGIYNDQGNKSLVWDKIKKLYNYGVLTRWIIIATFIPYWLVRFFISSLLKFKNPIARFRNYKKRRGMSFYHDWIDWLGGYPFEVATPEYIVDYYSKYNLFLIKLRTTSTLGVNQFVFQKID